MAEECPQLIGAKILNVPLYASGFSLLLRLANHYF